MRIGKMKVMCLLISAIILLSVLSGCGVQKAQEDIIVLFTNDVHCAADEGIGYAGLVSYQELCRGKTPYVTLVDCGDAIQGNSIGTVSHGEYLVDMMNCVGYDIAVLGNHEFDYGMGRLSELIGKSNADYLGCNLAYLGIGENKLSAVKPYKIITYGDTDVAYIGVLTPESISKSTPAYFMENGEFIYGFHGDSGNSLYSCVQGYIDECRKEGADYVIVLSHLGDNAESSPFTSVELIQNTIGVDAVLDGHSHSTVPCRVEKSRDGETVLLSSAGTKLQNIGQLIITPSGTISTGLISDYRMKDRETENYITQLKADYETTLNRTVASTDMALTGYDADGIRLVRNRETTIGNFCADAYRAVSGADIAFVNGGGIRADLPSGEITYSDIIAVHPYGNSLCVVKATGQEILDCLEMASRYTQAETVINGNAEGECGGFQQVSGLKYTIDTSVSSTVTLDENGMFLSVGGAQRVCDVAVLNANDSYEPLDPKKIYTVASHNYMIKECGDGFTMFSDNEFVIDCGMSDYQILITYITEKLCGNMKAIYSHTDGRITVK